MSIASEITRLQNDSAAIAAAIAAKGVTVPSGSGFDDYATLIGQIPGGGGSDPDAWLKDGDTHLWIEIEEDDLLAVDLRLALVGTIDWGDGTSKTTANATSYTTFSHTYTEKGKYRIDLHPTSGNFYLGGGGNSYNVMGSRTNARLRNGSILYQVEIGTSRMTGIRTYAFYYCIGLQNIYVPKTITSIGQYAFGYCYSLQRVEFENDMTIATVSSNAFYNCFAFKTAVNFTRNNTATTEGTIIRGCWSVREYTLHAGATTITSNAFQNTYGLTILNCLPASAPTISNSNAVSGMKSTCTIRVPIGSLSSYQGANIWSDRAAYMEEAGIITYSLTHVLASNTSPMATKNGSFTTTLSAEDGYTLGTVTVKMGGVDITSTAYSAGVVTIASVTGDIVITASAS